MVRSSFLADGVVVRDRAAVSPSCIISFGVVIAPVRGSARISHSRGGWEGEPAAIPAHVRREGESGPGGGRQGRPLTFTLTLTLTLRGTWSPRAAG